jgi:hypothetical protein
MSIYRWATYSVKDHNHPDAFIADVLLYDRLVVPVPPESEPAEYDRWTHQGWAPGRLLSMLSRIEDLVERVPWDEYRRQQFHDQWDAARQVGMDPYYPTRMFLKMELDQQSDRPNPNKGELVRPIVAFDSEQEFEKQVIGRRDLDVQAGVDKLAIAFRHRFLVPDTSLTHVERLQRAAELARSPDFKKARTGLYDWQEEVIARGHTVRQAVDEMEQLLDEYEKELRRAKWHSAARYAIFVAGLTVPVVREAGLLAAGVSLAFESGLKMLEFLHHEKEGAGLSPAAMLHTAQKSAGLTASAKAAN